MIPDDEKGRCAVVGMKHGIDYRLLIALRETENGRPGLDFGVEDPAAAIEAYQSGRVTGLEKITPRDEMVVGG